MKQSSVLLLTVAALASAGPIGMIGSVVGGLLGGGGKKSKRDVEYEDALLVIRDRTIQEWDAAVYNPATISPEMLQALKAKGFNPPANVKSTYVAPAGGAQNAQTVAKSYALKSVQAGYPIPPSTLQHMAKAGWTGPGLSKRDAFSEYLDFEARGLDEDYLDLFAREFDEYDY